MNSESLLCLASCESVFSYCCPISHIVVNAYCLSHLYLSYCILCIFSLYHNSLQRPFCIPPTLQTFSFITFRDAKWCVCSAPSICPLLPFLWTLCSHSLMFFWPLCAFSLTFATPHHPVSVAVIFNYLIVIKLNTRCRQWQSLEVASPWFKALSQNDKFIIYWCHLHSRITIARHILSTEMSLWDGLFQKILCGHFQKCHLRQKIDTK